MKKLTVKVWCEASYTSEIDVPDDMTLEEAYEYACDHLDEIPLGELEYLPYSDSIDSEDDCWFDDSNED